MSLSCPKLSFVVPVYNVASYLEECLSSLCGQTFMDVEVICIDDGSTDGSDEILSRWALKDQRVCVVSQPNGGVSRARNAGLSLARGDYVWFVDGDDYIDLDATSELLSEACGQDADIVVFGVRAFPEEPQWVGEMFNPRDFVFEGDGRDVLLAEAGCIPSASNKIYRREFLTQNSIRFDEDLVLGEDAGFQYSAFPLAEKVVFDSRRFYLYRFMREGSAVRQGDCGQHDQAREHVKLFSSVSSEWKQKGYIGGYEGRLLESLSYLFYDVLRLDFEYQKEVAFSFARAFCEVYDKDDLGGVSRESRWIYQALLSAGSDDCSANDAQRILVSCRRKVGFRVALRGCKYRLMRSLGR